MVRRVRLERFLCKVFYKMSYKLANRSLYGRYIDVEDKGYLTRSIIRRINAVFIHFFVGTIFPNIHALAVTRQ